MRTPHPPERWPSRLLALLLGFGLGLAGAEAGLRLEDHLAGRTAEDWLPQLHRDFSQAMYVPHPYLGIAPRPGFRSKARAGGLGYNYDLNAFGLRGPETTLEKPAGLRRIVCLGGSTTFCTGARSNDQTWPAGVETLLKASGRLRAPVEVLNAGVPGYSTAESLINLSLRMLDFAPDLVLIYHAPNDMRLAQAQGFRSDYSHGRRAWSIPDAPPLDGWLSRHCRLYARLQAKLAGHSEPYRAPVMQELVFAPDLGERAVPASVEVVAAGQAAYRRNLKSLVALARMGGAQPVLQTFAFVHGMDREEGTDLSAAMDQVNQTIRELAVELDLPLIDIAGPLSDRRELFDDWMHYNPRGCGEHAKLVARGLLELGLL
jgi:lysophospholipase L1-like esterase